MQSWIVSFFRRNTVRVVLHAECPCDNVIRFVHHLLLVGLSVSCFCLQVATYNDA